MHQRKVCARALDGVLADDRHRAAGSQLPGHAERPPGQEEDSVGDQHVKVSHNAAGASVPCLRRRSRALRLGSGLGASTNVGGGSAALPSDWPAGHRKLRKRCKIWTGSKWLPEGEIRDSFTPLQRTTIKTAVLGRRRHRRRGSMD